MENTQSPTEAAAAQTQPPAQDSGKTLLAWSARSQAPHARTPRWYAVMSAFALAICAYGAYTGAWSIILVTVLCAGMYWLAHDHVPPLKDFAIREDGVLYDTRFTGWETIEGFWFVHARHFTELRVVLKDKRGGEIVIQTGETPLEDIRAAMGTHARELTEKSERFLDILARLCKL